MPDLWKCLAAVHAHIYVQPHIEGYSGGRAHGRVLHRTSSPTSKKKSFQFKTLINYHNFAHLQHPLYMRQHIPVQSVVYFYCYRPQNIYQVYFSTFCMGLFRVIAVVFSLRRCIVQIPVRQNESNIPTPYSSISSITDNYGLFLDIRCTIPGMRQHEHDLQRRSGLKITTGRKRRARPKKRTNPSNKCTVTKISDTMLDRHRTDMMTNFYCCSRSECV